MKREALVNSKSAVWTLLIRAYQHPRYRPCQMKDFSNSSTCMYAGACGGLPLAQLFSDRYQRHCVYFSIGLRGLDGSIAASYVYFQPDKAV